MRPIHSSLHHLLDFVTVLVFALAPSLLGLIGAPAILSYALASVHLGLTLLTEFTGSGPRPVPFHLHGIIEGAVGPALILLPLIAGWTGTPRLFYFGAGIVIVAVRAGTDYRRAGREHAG